MNSMEWLKSVGEKVQKSPVPPVPPEAALWEKGLNTLIPPVPPCSPEHFVENEANSKGDPPVQKEMYWGDKPEVETSRGLRGNQGFYRGIQDLGHTEHTGNQGKMGIPEYEPPCDKPRKPFLTPGGDLSIPFDSDPKYCWWKPGGQSVKQTRAEVLAWMAAERAEPNG